MRVPRSALGKTGLCPACGRAIVVRADNTSPSQPGVVPNLTGKSGETEAAPIPANDDKARFARAVDLYAHRRYAESFVILDMLLNRYPGNPEVENARSLCLRALHSRNLESPEQRKKRLGAGQLDAEFVRSFLLDIMLNGSSERAQLEATELACRILGLLPGSRPALPEPHPAFRQPAQLRESA